MKTFKEHMSEETNPFALSNGFVGVEDEKARDNINALLNGITMKPFLTPYIALERVAKVLANYHIHLPKHTFEDIDEDSVAFEVNQFGEKAGMTNDGEVVSKMSDPYFIYFEYNQNEQGTYDVFCEIVDADDLEELMSGEEELDESVQIDEACWEGYRQEGTKMKNGRRVPNCVPINEEQIDELDQETYKNYHAAAGLSLKAKRQKLDRGTLTSKDLRQGQNRVKGLNRSAKKMNEEQLDEKLSPEQKRKIRRRLGPNTPDNRMRQNSDSAREEIRLAKRGGKDKDLNEATEKRKELLKRYIKQASHDVAARSAAVRGFARDADDQRKSGKAMDARRSDARADKMFKKSWNRRQYMAKAVDKLTSEEMIDKSVVGSGTIMKTDPKTGKKTDYISPVTLNNPHMQASKDEFKMPNPVPLPPRRRKELLDVQIKKMASDSDIEAIKKDLMKESNPAKAGAIAAGYKGSNPAEQGSIAVMKDDEARDRKANFKVAKKLAKDAKKTAMKKAMEKKSSK